MAITFFNLFSTNHTCSVCDYHREEFQHISMSEKRRVNLFLILVDVFLMIKFDNSTALWHEVAAATQGLKLWCDFCTFLAEFNFEMLVVMTGKHIYNHQQLLNVGKHHKTPPDGDKLENLRCTGILRPLCGHAAAWPTFHAHPEVWQKCCARKGK